MKRRYSLASLIMLVMASFLIPLCGACAGTSSSGEQTEADNAADSLATTTEPASVQTPILPDTMFASIEGMSYEVLVYDSVTSGQVSGYEDLYQKAPGILTFRGSMDRTAPFTGHVEGVPDTVIVEWTVRTRADNRKSNLGTWGGGTGWTGQPLYIEWPDSLADAFRQDTMAHATLPSNKEIIVGSLNSRIYFIDYESGEPSRDTLYVNNPIKGTLMLDPTLNGRLYVGHGVMADPQYGWGQALIDLHKHEVIDFYGRDRKAWRGWNGNDASPLRIGQFVFHVSENGMIYKWLVTADGRKLHSALRYKISGSAPGFEASMSVWGNYGYVNDNHGNVLCVNLDNLQPVWRYDLRDDCDCTPIVSHEEAGTFIYTGSEVDIHPRDSLCRFVKLDALTGAEIWKLQTPSQRKNKGEKHFDGGYYSSTLMGRGNCSHLLFTNRVLNTNGQNGEFVAIDKQTGQELYTTHLKTYAWSSPVALLNEKDEMFILTFDTIGNCYLIEGKTGRITYTARIGGNFESSPVVIDNCVVIGSRDGKIYKLRIEKRGQ